MVFLPKPYERSEHWCNCPNALYSVLRVVTTNSMLTLNVSRPLCLQDLLLAFWFGKLRREEVGATELKRENHKLRLNQRHKGDNGNEKRCRLMPDVWGQHHCFYTLRLASQSERSFMFSSTAVRIECWGLGSELLWEDSCCNQKDTGRLQEARAQEKWIQEGLSCWNI